MSEEKKAFALWVKLKHAVGLELFADQPNKIAVSLIEHELTSLRAQVERLEKQVEEYWQPTVREMQSTFEFGANVMNRLVLPRIKSGDSEGTDGTALELLTKWLNERDSLTHRLEACEKALKGALEYMRHAPICSIRNARKCDCGLPEVEEAALKALEGRG